MHTIENISPPWRRNKKVSNKKTCNQFYSFHEFRTVAKSSHMEPNQMSRMILNMTFLVKLHNQLMNVLPSVYFFNRPMTKSDCTTQTNDESTVLIKSVSLATSLVNMCVCTVCASLLVCCSLPVRKSVWGNISAARLLSRSIFRRLCYGRLCGKMFHVSGVSSCILGENDAQVLWGNDTMILIWLVITIPPRRETHRDDVLMILGKTIASWIIWLVFPLAGIEFWSTITPKCVRREGCVIYFSFHFHSNQNRHGLLDAVHVHSGSCLDDVMHAVNVLQGLISTLLIQLGETYTCMLLSYNILLYSRWWNYMRSHLGVTP